MSSQSEDAGVARDAKFMINPYVRVIQCGNNEVLVKHGSRSRFSELIRDDAKSGLLARILRALSKPVSFVDLEESGVVNESNTEDVANLVHYLLERKIAISPSEHLPWVYFSMQPGGVSTDALGAKRVGMVGSGFLGARIAQELARARIKEVILLDDRKAGPRDATCFECGSDLVKDGRRHVDVAQEILKSTGYESTRKFDAPMSDEEALRDVFEQSDVVITALEWFSPNTLHAVNAAALEAGKPWMSVYFDGSEALIGPIYVPGETPCYNEFELQNEACVTLQDDYHVYKDSLLDEGAKGRRKNRFRFSLHGFDGVVPFGQAAVTGDA